MRDDLGGADGFSGEPEGSGFDPRVILDFVRRRKLVILLVSIPLLLPATILPFTLSSYYEATATVVIKTPPKVMEFGVDFMPGAGGDARAPGRFGGGTSENALITLVYSDAVLGRVVDQLPVSGEAPKSLLDSARDAVTQTSPVPLTADQGRAQRIQLMRNSVVATVTGGGNYLTITSVGGSAGAVTFVANSVADAYVGHQDHQREEASRRALAWLNQQVYELREQAARKEQALAEIASVSNLSPSMLEDDEDDSEGDSLYQVESDLQTARINLMAAQERLAALRPRVARPTGDSRGDAAAANLREQYGTAVTELEGARLRFTPTHPEVRRLEAVVASLSGRIGKNPSETGQMLTATEETEYQSLLAEESQQRGRVKVLEKARVDLSTATGSKAEAVGRYRRLAKELSIDKQLLEVLMTRRNETLLTSATKEVGAEVLDYAVPPSIPTGPNRGKYLAAGYGLALAIGIGLAFLLELLDRRVRDPETVATMLGTTSLGMIPLVEGQKSAPEWQSSNSPGSAAGESYRNVRTSLLFAMRTAKLHCLLVTSAVSGEGKTTTSVNLAGAFARMGRKVVLVDADLRRPRVHRVFKLSGSPGLSDVLQGQARIEDAVIRPERVEFDFLPAGTMAENPSELLGSTTFSQTVADLKSEYDLVILDSAVLLAVPDALLLAAEADGTLLVHKPGSVDRRALKRMREDLSRAGARVLGVVFNQVDPASSLHYPNYMYSPYIKQDKA